MTSAGEYEGGRSALATPGGFEPPTTTSSALKRWWLVAVLVALSLLGGFIYLAMAQRVYTVSAVLALDAGADAKSADQFLIKQREVIRTPEVLGSNAAQLRSDLRVTPSSHDDTITLSLDSAEPAAATRKLTEITTTYLNQLAAGSSPSGTDKLRALTAERDRLAAERSAKAKALMDFQTKANITGTSADKAAHDRLEQLRAALKTAQLEAAMAQAEAASVDGVLADPGQRAAMIQKYRGTGTFTALDEQRGKIQAELDGLQQQMQKQKETLLPQHPAFVQTQQKVDRVNQRLAALDEEYAKAYRGHAQQQVAATDKRMKEVAAMVEAQSAGTQDYAANIKRSEELQAELKAAEAALTEADRKISEAALAVDPTSMTMRLIQPPKAGERPTHPQPMRVMLIAGAIGVGVGMLLALLTARSR